MSKLRRDEHTEAKELTAAMVIPKAEEEVDINDMPLTTLGEYMRYNEKARGLNKKLRICRYPIKPCPAELHPTDRVVLTRNDRNTSNIPVYLSNDLIDFKMWLEPGKPYDLPRCIIAHLSDRGTPDWKWFANTDGSKETRIAGYTPRFSIRTIY